VYAQHTADGSFVFVLQISLMGVALSVGAANINIKGKQQQKNTWALSEKGSVRKIQINTALATILLTRYFNYCCNYFRIHNILL